MHAMLDAPFTQPKSPVFGWASLRGGAAQAPGVQQLPHTRLTTSGRAAILQALRQMKLPAGSAVLLPSYHCPTMVAPVLVAGLEPRYYGLDAQGLPLLPESPGADVRAVLVPQLFGIARSLAPVRAWCDRHGVSLIEDCAHCLFGQAGERPVGAWGDWATASLTKFLPVPEAGLLASAQHAMQEWHPVGRGALAECKAVLDTLELASRFRRLSGLNSVLAALFALKNRGRASSTSRSRSAPPVPSAEQLMRGCDMARVDSAPLRTSAWLAKLPQTRVVLRRQALFRRYQQGLQALEGARPLFADAGTPLAPYVFPLWVDDAEPVYRQLHALNAPVFRWDQLWPGTPADLPGDQGPLWSRHVLQLLCHQDLDDAEVERLIALLRRLTQPLRETV